MDKMRLLLLGSIICVLTACNFPRVPVSNLTPNRGIPTWTAPAPVGAVAEGLDPPPTQPALGTVENPMILALTPSVHINGERVEAGKRFADLLSEETGHAFVVVVPESYSRLVEALGQGNAHIAYLSPYAYAFAYQQGYANAAFAGLKSGEDRYGAQFIARKDAGFRSFFDAYANENKAAATAALAQFNEKKPCWADEFSASGYVIPAGVLAYHGFVTRPAAFMQGQPTVVRGVYASGICDFGATYIDARTFPTVREAYPDVLEEVVVIWRVPAIIPYETLSLATVLPEETRSSLKDAVLLISGTQAGREILNEAYGNGDWEPVSDSFYESFRMYLEASGIDLAGLLD
jgi:phosphonate transport system substrate-binding protein